jgi:CHRD domain
MRSKASLAALAIGAIALAGCGSSNKTTSGATASTAPATATAPPPGAVTISHPPAPAKPRTYRVKLAGSNEVPAGAPAGSAIAVISIKAKGEVCWKFSALKGVVAPAVAHIHHGASGTSGPIVIPLGGAYKPSGCVTATAPQLLALIEANPQRFYVNIHNTKYPGGAVRAQL